MAFRSNWHFQHENSFHDKLSPALISLGSVTLAQLELAQRSSAFIWYLVCLKMAQTRSAFIRTFIRFRLVFFILILIWIWSLVFDILMIQILALYCHFKGATNIHILQILIWDFDRHWRFPTEVWHLDLNLDMVTYLWYSLLQILAVYIWFEGTKNIYVL